MEKKWVAHFDELKGILVFKYTNEVGIPLSPRQYFNLDALAAAEKDERKTLRLGQNDIDYPRAMAAFMKVQEDAERLGKS